MKRLTTYFLIVLLALGSCKKEDNRTDLEKFLMKENIEVPIIIGDWSWYVTSGGSSPTTYFPETENYSKTIMFEIDGKYKEYIDSALHFETLYRIEHIEYSQLYEIDYYRLYFFENKEYQNFYIYQSGDETRLYLSDNCKNCIGNHVYKKNKNVTQ